MFYFSKPAGGLYVGKRLTKSPHVQRLCVGMPVKTLFVSDLHIRRNTHKTMHNLLNTIHHEKPELILLGGDYAEYDEGFEYFFKRLRHVKPRHGIYAVEGNNDVTRFSGDRDKIRSVMEENGVTLLRDECARIDTDNGAIEIVGVNDAYDPETEIHIEGLFSVSRAVYRVLLAHEPIKSTLEKAEGLADLMLSGHTHGGQINVLGLTCYELLGYESYFKYTHIAGKKQIGSTTCIVSRGIGTSKFAIRFGARPEMHILI